MLSVDSAAMCEESAGKKGGVKKDTVRPQEVQVEKKESHVLQQPSDNVASFPAAVQDEEEEELTADDFEHLETGGPGLQPTGKRSRFQILPEEFERLLGGRVFATEEEFEAALQELKIEDEQLVLGEDGRAYHYMPGDEHNAATKLIVRRFHLWACFVKGTAGENTNIRLGPSLPGAPPARKRRKPKTRLPDVALWGRSKCEVDEETGQSTKPLRVFPTAAQPVVHPHVVIQVSVFNDEDYEIDAINDLATRAAAGQGAKPNLGVLVKVRIDPITDEPAGCDICYLPAGVYWSDAVNGTNGAKHVVYNRNGPDVLVTITQEDLGGINLSMWQSFKNVLKNYLNNGNSGSRDFQLSMAELFGALY